VTISGRNTKNAYVGAHTGAGLYAHGVAQRRAIAGVTDHRGGTELAASRRRRAASSPAPPSIGDPVKSDAIAPSPRAAPATHPRLRACRQRDRRRPDHRRRPHLMKGGDHSMSKQRPFAGLTFGPEDVRGDRARFDARPWRSVPRRPWPAAQRRGQPHRPARPVRRLPRRRRPRRRRRLHQPDLEHPGDRPRVHAGQPGLLDRGGLQRPRLDGPGRRGPLRRSAAGDQFLPAGRS
jgi:hypothetical protein